LLVIAEYASQAAMIWERRDVGDVGAELRLALGECSEEGLVRCPTADLGQQLLVEIQPFVGDAQRGRDRGCVVGNQRRAVGRS
jgi:hypothetical protein